MVTISRLRMARAPGGMAVRLCDSQALTDGTVEQRRVLVELRCPLWH